MPEKPIERMIIDRTDEDIISIGDIAKNILGGRGGILLQAIVNNVVDTEEKKSEENLTTSKAEFRLGRISGAKLVLHNLENCVYQAQMMRDKKQQDIDAVEPEGIGPQPVYKGMSGRIA